MRLKRSPVRQRLEPFNLPSCQTFHKHYPSFLHLTNYDFFQCTRGNLFVAILLRFFRPSFDPLSTPVSLVQHSPSHSGSLDELYVVTPISMYLEAIEGWAIMPPRFQELSARWSLFKQRFFLGGTNRCLRTFSLMLYWYTHTRHRPCPSVSSKWAEKLCIVLTPPRHQSITMDSYHPHGRSLRDTPTEPYPNLPLPSGQPSPCHSHPTPVPEIVL